MYIYELFKDMHTIVEIFFPESFAHVHCSYIVVIIIFRQIFIVRCADLKEKTWG